MDIRAISVPEISLLRSLSRRQWFLLEREKNWLLRRRAKHYREAALLIFHAGHYVDLMVRKQNWRFLFFSNNKTMSITMLHHDAHCTLFTKMWKSSIWKKKAYVEGGHLYLEKKMINLRDRVLEEVLIVTKSVTFFRQFLLEIDTAWTGTYCGRRSSSLAAEDANERSASAATRRIWCAYALWWSKQSNCQESQWNHLVMHEPWMLLLWQWVGENFTTNITLMFLKQVCFQFYPFLFWTSHVI